MTRARKTFREAIEVLTPWWMRAGDGLAVLQSLAVMKDIMLERIQQSVLLRFPSHCPEDALPYIGADRVMPQIEDEPTADYRVRLLGWRGRWGHKYRGNPFALLNLCLLALGDSLRSPGAYTVDRRGNLYNMTAPDSYTATKEAVTWDWDGVAASPQWGRGWLVFYVDAQPWDDWDDLLDALWYGRENASMGMKNWQRSRARTIRGLVYARNPWKPAGVRAEYAIYLPTGLTDFPEPDGTWGRYFGSTRPTYAVFGRLKPEALG